MPESITPPRRPSNPLLAALRLAFRFVCSVVILLDELVRPLYRPLLQRLADLRLMQALEVWVAAQPPYLVLLLIGLPYVVVEPLKFLSLAVAAHGHVKTGTLAFLVANLVSFVLIERVFSAGKPQLMTLRPMAWLITTAASVRASLVARLRLAELRMRLRVLARWARLHLR